MKAREVAMKRTQRGQGRRGEGQGKVRRREEEEEEDEEEQEEGGDRVSEHKSLHLRLVPRRQSTPLCFTPLPSVDVPKPKPRTRSSHAYLNQKKTKHVSNEATTPTR